MPVARFVFQLPAAPWRAVQALAPSEGDTNAIILRAVEECVETGAKRKGRRSGKCRKRVQALSGPVADLHLSARPAYALQTLNVRYAYELFQKSSTDLFGLPNFGNKSLKEIRERPAAWGLTLGMKLEDDAYQAAIVAAVAVNIAAAEGGAA